MRITPSRPQSFSGLAEGQAERRLHARAPLPEFPKWHAVRGAGRHGCEGDGLAIPGVGRGDVLPTAIDRCDDAIASRLEP